MDMLFKRYACPFPFLEQLLLMGRFGEWVEEFIGFHNEEVEDQSLWDMYLHSQFLAESFDEFKKRCKVPSHVEKQPEINLEATVKSSFDMLGDFVPDDIEE